MDQELPPDWEMTWGSPAHNLPWFLRVWGLESTSTSKQILSEQAEDWARGTGGQLPWVCLLHHWFSILTVHWNHWGVWGGQEFFCFVLFF